MKKHIKTKEIYFLFSENQTHRTKYLWINCSIPKNKLMHYKWTYKSKRFCSDWRATYRVFQNNPPFTLNADTKSFENCVKKATCFRHKLTYKLRSEQFIATYLFFTLKLFLLKTLTGVFKVFEHNYKTHVLKSFFFKTSVARYLIFFGELYTIWLEWHQWLCMVE